MHDKYCLPIIKPSKKEVLEAIEKNLDHYGFFEVWIDYIEDFDQLFIDKLIKEYDSRILIVFRRQNLEPMNLPLDKRLAILEQINGTQAMVDLDVTAQTEELKHSHNNKPDLRFIASYHNYELTPMEDALKLIISNLKSYKPEIIKISTMCNEPEDALRLLKLKVPLLENGEKHIILGMGEHGKITRAFGALWGNELIFLPEDEEESSAPGQFSRTEMDKILERIKK